MKKFFGIFIGLVMLMPMTATAECVSTDSITKCARLPTCFGGCGGANYTNQVSDPDGVSWSFYRDGIPYSGTSSGYSEGPAGVVVDCTITSPFLATVGASAIMGDTGADICVFIDMWETSVYNVSPTKLDGDMCPDGFFTVPYEETCGIGMVDTTGIIDCADDTSGDFCLMPTVELICPAGQYANVNTVTCESCPAGTYSDSDGAFACTACPAGTYSGVGATSCTTCPAGMYSDTTGATECVDCIAKPCDPATGLPTGDPENEYGLGPDSNCDYASFSHTGYDTSAQTWWTTCDDIKISGDYVCSSTAATTGAISKDMPTVDTSDQKGYLNGNCWCKMTAPFVGQYWVSTGDVAYGSAEEDCIGSSVANGSCAWQCSRLWNQTTSGYNQEYGHYGYYTDDGLVKYKTSLFMPEKITILCELGISALKTSSGLSFALYAEKYTTPAINIGYDGGMCYANLEPGLSAGAINVSYDGQIYHTVE